MSDKSVRVPKQARSIEKKNQIKQAALELMSEKGYFGTTSNEIAKKAGLSIGTFYSYFANKKDLYEELVKDLYQTVLEQLPRYESEMDLSPTELVRNRIQMIMQLHTYMSDFQKEITCLSQRYDEFRAIEAKYHLNLTTRAMQLLNNHKDILRITDISTAVLLINRSLEAVAHELQFYPNSFDQDKIIDELTDMFCQYAIKPEFLSDKKTDQN
ncbi:TetR/AcrR family transcriptional regulator [Roseburia sp. 499]|uniref:TetR/AcrR family transcriptional regulator n=1 Tax=Roseburia sp. 499 TaxID=1261634 RepID=UPI000953552B|nr:TetR/AcrR family transcriptional regulator [Roseburia sp. 499]WVK69414.1 TetR/AcrR family transcriptional regulator [Roseburia sp. 499]